MTRLNPIYTTLEPNTPILLYEGKLVIGEVRKNLDDSIIRLDWLPSPKTRFEVLDASDYKRAGPTVVSLPDSKTRTYAFVEKVAAGSQQPIRLLGHLTGPIEIGSGETLAYLLFHLANFESLWTGKAKVPSERLSEEWEPHDIYLEAEGWRVRIEADSNIGKLEDLVKSTGGYIITHIGRLERSDGSTFSSQEADEMLGILHYFLSFVRGFWVTPILPFGFDSEGNRLWERWGTWKMDSWRSRASWCDSQHGESLSLAFPGFVSRWRDALWHEPIRFALHWYIEANRGGSDVEAFIVLSQAALDLLAGTLLVEELNQATESEFDKPSIYPAHRKIRDTLKWAGIPTHIPMEVVELNNCRLSEGWEDGPHAFTAARNWIGHPTRKNRARFSSLSSGAISDVWHLGMWYLDLVLLRLMDFDGDYANRLIRPRSNGHADRVPWKKS